MHQEPNERLRISKQAFEKFEASVALQPQDAKSLVMWADSCLNIALADAELESAFGLLEKAYELSYRADELCEGIGSYTIGTSPITISVVCTHSLTHSLTHSICSSRVCTSVALLRLRGMARSLHQVPPTAQGRHLRGPSVRAYSRFADLPPYAKVSSRCVSPENGVSVCVCVYFVP